MQLFLFALLALAGFFIKKQNAEQSEDSESEETLDIILSKSTEHSKDYQAVVRGINNHTFVALIDIAFTDGTKRTCTGTIIHNNVVITARHCFGKTHDKFVHPEITASFVVIGSKKMFEAGYEQYLPIERIISHPKYKGWMADIALVYTFAGMMSDKPGTIIPLAGDKVTMPNNCNVTVFSWGRCKESDIQSEKENDHHERIKRTRYPLRAKLPSSSFEEESIIKPSKIKNSKVPRQHTKASQKPKIEKSKRNKTKKHEKTNKKYYTKTEKVTEGMYRAHKLRNYYTDEDSLNAEYESEVNHDVKLQDSQKHYGSIFKNWRRTMGPEKNELSVENFRFITTHTCEEMMRKALPEKYNIKNPNEFICYASEDHFVTDEDAGAPGVRHGHLVAMTVGGVECDGEHVAVGIKISCFCTWIADNLPDEGTRLKCCDHCCDEAKPPPPDDEDKDETALRTGKKKKVRS